ncbi:MAG TPA: glycosyltransferase family 2 protein [Bryobacteraceae bacterium]
MEETQTAPRVSVLVVSYNHAAALRRCLEALERSEERERIEVLVVDNGSGDESVAVIAEFPSVTPLHLPRNFGFTKALNIGMRTAKAELFCFLNPRVEVEPGTIKALADRLEVEPDAVAVCPSLVTPDGAPAPLLYRLPDPGDIGALAGNGAFEAAPAPREDAAPVAFASFACLLARAYFLKGLRHIDERYAQSWGDAEIAAQIRRSGKKVLRLASARAVWHAEDDIRAGMPPAALALLKADWTLGAAAFAGKHFGAWAGWKLRLAATLGALVRFRLRLFSYLLTGQKVDGTQGIL